MICLLAFLVFGLLAIFSARHRPLAREALDCVFRRFTFRKCESQLDKRLKAQISGSIIGKSPVFGKFVFRHFEFLSWLFLIVMMASFAYSSFSLYNYVNYGNCYGPEAPDLICPLSILEGETYSGYFQNYTGPRILPDADDEPFLGPENASVTVIEFGCLMCPYTKRAESTVMELVKRYPNVKFVFRDFPLDMTHAGSVIYAEAASCAWEQGKYFEYRAEVFMLQDTCRVVANHTDTLLDIARELNLNMSRFEECLSAHKYLSEIEKDFMDGVAAGIAGTPTFFIGEHVITGPKPIKAFEHIIDKELAKGETDECG